MPLEARRRRVPRGRDSEDRLSHSPTPSDAENAPRNPRNDPRELVLVKRGQRYVFRCAPGEEAQLLEQLRTLVDDPGNDLTWFDAAVLSHQVGRRLSQKLKNGI